MALFIKMEDNEDGTITIITNYGGESKDDVMTLVVAMSFDDIVRSFSASTDIRSDSQAIVQSAVVIPNDIEEA